MTGRFSAQKKTLVNKHKGPSRGEMKEFIRMKGRKIS